MDERNNIIKELEDKNSADTEARNRLLTGLGETLIRKIGDKPLSFADKGSPGAVLEEYRQLEREIAESREIIKSLEVETHRLKELESEISGKEKEEEQLEKESRELNEILGKLLLPDPQFEDLAGSSRQQEENLLGKIDELEKKLEDLGEQSGGFLAWLGKNAQIAVSKNLLQRNRSSLQRLYRNVGAKFLSLEHELTVDGEAGETVIKARDLKNQMNAVDEELTLLKGERKKIIDLFGVEGSPSRRITGLEKRIAYIKGVFPGICLRFGSLAADEAWAGVFSPFMEREESDILEMAELLYSKIAERELKIKKLNAAITIDKKKAEIEKLRRAIDAQQQKMQFAAEAISGFERQISQSEQQIGELKTFLQQNE